MELATDRLILRELAERDAQRVYEIESTPGVGRYLSRFADTPEGARE